MKYALLALVVRVLVAVQIPLSTAAASSRWIILSDIDGSAIDSVIAYMKQRQPDARVIVIAGNFLQHHPQRTYSAIPTASQTAAAENAMRSIAQQFDRAFPHAQFLIALGEDDDPCGPYQSTAHSAYLRAIAKIWEPLVNRNGAAPEFMQSFSTGGYYTARIGTGHLRAIVANTTYWSSGYKDACARAPEHPGTDELTWFERTLGSTARDDMNLVLLHIPPGIAAFSSAIQAGAGAVTYLNGQANQGLLQIIGDPKYHVSTVIAGHAGRTEFRWINGVPLLIAPPIARPLRGNPMFLIADVQAGESIVPTSPTLINDFAAFMLNDSGEWNGIYDFGDAFNQNAFDATTYCSQDELDQNYLGCINQTQQH